MGDEYDRMKHRAASWAVEQVDDGMVVGLGTGSTAGFAIAELGRAVDAGLAVEGVATSFAARSRALKAGIPLTTLDAVSSVDVAIDGADQVCDAVLLKGGGGAHTRERLVDANAARFIVVVDERKVSNQLDGLVHLEVLPEAHRTVSDAVASLGGEPTVRQSTTLDGPTFTERGNLLVDVDFGVIDRPVELAEALSQLSGVVDHGIFVEMAEVIAVGTADGVRLLE